MSFDATTYGLLNGKIGKLSEEKMSQADYTKEINTSVIDPALFKNACIETNTGVYLEVNYNSAHAACKEYIPVVQGGRYTFKFGVSSSNFALYIDFYAEMDENTWVSRAVNYWDDVYDGAVEFNVPATVRYARFYFYSGIGTFADVKPNDMLLYVYGSEPVLDGQRMISNEKLDIEGIYSKMVAGGLLVDGNGKMTEADYTEEVGTSFINPTLFSNAIIGASGKYSEYTNGKNYASCKEFIPIVPGTAYTFEYANTVPVALYADLYADADESTWISRTLQYANASNSRVHKFQTPNNAKYIRFCFYKEGTDYADVKPISMLLYITYDGPVLEGGRVISAAKVDIVGIYERMVSEGLIDGDMPVPAYYKDASYLSNKVNRIRELLDECAGDGDAFMFVTDQHWELNARQSPALMNYIAKHVHIPRVFSGGDTSDTFHEQYANALSAAFSGDIHHCSGNHDWGSSGAMNGNKLAYIWDMGKREQIGNAKRHYYYVDNPQQSIRYIVLCAYSNETGSLVTAYDEEQINWLRDVALNVESGWTVLVFTHSLYYGFGVNAAISPSPEGATTVIEVLDAATCDVACVIQGHAHLDRIVHTTGGIPVVLTTSDKYMPWMSGETNNEPWLSETRTLGTITEQAFDVVVLDKANRQLTFVRIGAPADNWTDGTSTGTVEERVVTY